MKGQRLTIRNAREIGTRLKVEKKEDVKIKLIFLNLMSSLEMGLEEACQLCGIATSTGYLRQMILL